MIPGPTAGTSGATLRVAGFPTRVRPTFLVLIALVGWYPGITVPRLALWIVVASAAVMWHELGHAFAARRLGASPTIELYGFGGATTWQPPDDPTRRQLIGVSFAGPAAGFTIGLAVAAGVLIAGTVGTGDARYLVLTLLWTNLGWGIVNLLPVLPLDGGHIMAELLPGDRATRNRRAATASVVVAGLAAVALLASGVVFGGMIFGWIVLTNLSTLRARRAATEQAALEERARAAIGRLGHRDDDAISEVERVAAEFRPHSSAFRAAAIETAAATGDAASARRLLDGAPPDEHLAPGIYALVFAAESRGVDGTSELAQLFRREPTSAHGRWLAIALRWGDRLGELASVLGSTDGIEPRVLTDTAAVAEGLGDPDTARAVRALAAG